MSEQKIIAACGNDCAACPRYCKAPFEKTEEELRHTAQLWFQIGYRDHLVTNEEIACTGCKKENWCRYQVVSCVSDKQLDHCGQCSLYPCGTIQKCFQTTHTFEPRCKEVCTEEEFRLMQTAFFEKEKNL